MGVKKYKYWDILDKIPEGWRIDKTCGSPLSGHEFITNSKSPLNGQKRALLKINKGLNENNKEIAEQEINRKNIHVSKKSDWTFDNTMCKSVNELARKRCEQRILNDIMVDLMICEIEGWVKTEYINELKKLISGLLSDKKEIINYKNKQIDVKQGVLF